MSRNIHVTRQTIAHARRFRYSNRERRAALIDDLEMRHLRKRRMKRAMRQKLGPALFPGAHVTADDVAISFDRRNPFARYPAFEADIRAILSRLPSGVLDGLNGISLKLGAEYQRDQAEEWHEQDPIVGRFGHETLPGVYCGLILGVCFWDAHRIQVYGFVATESVAEPWALYLRLHMLSTLVHEVAHHEDLIKGWALDRWTGDDEHKTEWYAEGRQLLWVETIVIPYLQETYPAEIALLEDWMQEYVGLVLPLRVLAGDARNHSKNYGKLFWRNAFGGSDGAFEEFVRAVDTGQDLTGARLELATSLHWAKEHEFALAILDQILSIRANHVSALVQKARICRNIGRRMSALFARMDAKRIDQTNSDVLAELAYLIADITSWDRVLDFTAQAIQFSTERFMWLRMRELQGRAHIALGNPDGERSIIAEFDATSKPLDARAAARLLALLDKAVASAQAQQSGEAHDDQN